MIRRLLKFCNNLGGRIKQQLKQWAKPTTATLVTTSLADMTRSKADLIVLFGHFDTGNCSRTS